MLGQEWGGRGRREEAGGAGGGGFAVPLRRSMPAGVGRLQWPPTAWPHTPSPSDGHPRFVLTAAHCLLGWNDWGDEAQTFPQARMQGWRAGRAESAGERPPASLAADLLPLPLLPALSQVRLAAYETNGLPGSYEARWAKWAAVHPGYAGEPQGFDFGLLMLDRPARTRPILRLPHHRAWRLHALCAHPAQSAWSLLLPLRRCHLRRHLSCPAGSAHPAVAPGSWVWAVGFGMVEDGAEPKVLQTVRWLGWGAPEGNADGEPAGPGAAADAHRRVRGPTRTERALSHRHRWHPPLQAPLDVLSQAACTRAFPNDKIVERQQFCAGEGGSSAWSEHWRRGRRPPPRGATSARRPSAAEGVPHALPRPSIHASTGSPKYNRDTCLGDSGSPLVLKRSRSPADDVAVRAASFRRWQQGDAWAAGATAALLLLLRCRSGHPAPRPTPSAGRHHVVRVGLRGGQARRVQRCSSGAALDPGYRELPFLGGGGGPHPAPARAPPRLTLPAHPSACMRFMRLFSRLPTDPLLSNPKRPSNPKLNKLKQPSMPTEPAER